MVWGGLGWFGMIWGSLGWFGVTTWNSIQILLPKRQCTRNPKQGFQTFGSSAGPNTVLGWFGMAPRFCHQRGALQDFTICVQTRTRASKYLFRCDVHGWICYTARCVSIQELSWIHTPTMRFATSHSPISKLDSHLLSLAQSSDSCSKVVHWPRTSCE
jgi:hypothetical protein